MTNGSSGAKMPLIGGHYYKIPSKGGRDKHSDGESVVEGGQEMASEEQGPNEEKDDLNFVDVPDIPLPTAKRDAEAVEDECRGAFNWAFVGAGQAGARLAEAFYALGYRRVCAINTTGQDLASIAIPDENKYVMDIGESGAGKNPEKGRQAVKQYYEDVYDLMRRSFGTNFERIITLAGAGGGTGGGCVDILNDIARDIAKSFKLGDEGEPAVGTLVSMPMTTEGQRVNANAHVVLDSLFSQAESGTLSPLIVEDNELIGKIYPGLAVSKFWPVANQSISSLFHLFNSIAVQDSDFITFDQADLKDVLGSGVVTFGACPIVRHEKATDISFSIRDNLRQNILVGDLDLKCASVAGCVFIGNENVLNEIPQSNLEHGFGMLSRIMQRDSTVHRGIYRGKKPGLVVYTILGGLELPATRMLEIARIGRVS